MTKLLETYEEIMMSFIDSTQTIIRHLKEQDKKFVGMKESPKTRGHYARKLLRAWFEVNGRVTI